MANNVVFNSIRMNMNNPQHVKVNAVLSNLDNNVCKSKNQMIIDAIEFYIDHFGKEEFTAISEEKASRFITVDDLEKVKAELTESVLTEARREVIRLLGTAVSGRVIIDSERITVPVEESPKAKDDVVVSDLATGCRLAKYNLLLPLFHVELFSVLPLNT